MREGAGPGSQGCGHRRSFGGGALTGRGWGRWEGQAGLGGRPWRRGGRAIGAAWELSCGGGGKRRGECPEGRAREGETWGEGQCAGVRPWDTSATVGGDWSGASAPSDVHGRHTLPGACLGAVSLHGVEAAGTIVAAGHVEGPLQHRHARRAAPAQHGGRGRPRVNLHQREGWGQTHH